MHSFTLDCLLHTITNLTKSALNQANKVTAVSKQFGFLRIKKYKTIRKKEQQEKKSNINPLL